MTINEDITISTSLQYLSAAVTRDEHYTNQIIDNRVLNYILQYTYSGI